MQQREFAFSRHNDVYIYGTELGGRWRQETYGNSPMWDVIMGQLGRSFFLTRNWHDTSGQYGYHGWMIDPVSGVLLVTGVVGLAIGRASLLSYFPHVWLFLILIAGWVLTENPPFSPRVVGAIPAISIMVGYGMSVVLTIIKRFGAALRITIISVIVCAIVVYNLFSYFIRGVADEWGDPNKYTATDIVKVMNVWPDYTFIMATAPYIHKDFGPIQYLAPNANIIPIDQPEDYQPGRVEKTLFILHPSYEQLLAGLIAENPSGIRTENISHSGETQIIYFRVP